MLSQLQMECVRVVNRTEHKEKWSKTQNEARMTETDSYVEREQGRSIAKFWTDSYSKKCTLAVFLLLLFTHRNPSSPISFSNYWSE